MVRNRLPITLAAALAFVFCAQAAQSQNIMTFAGGGNPSGPATAVPIGQPWSLVQDASGNTYIADNHSNRIFKMNSSGNLTVVAGNSADGLTPSSTPLPATGTSLSFPQALALDTTNGALYLADDGNNEIRVVNTNATGSITLFPSAASPVVVPAGQIADVAGLPGGAACFVSFTPTCGDGQLATNAGLNIPAGVAVDSFGDLFIADTGDNVIREVAHDTGVITKVAGTYCNGSCTGGGDGGPASAASFNTPGAVALDSSGNIYVADASDHVIRVINATGSTLSLFEGALTVAPGEIQTVVGTFGKSCSSGGTPPLCGDTGASTNARLNLPSGILVDAHLNIYIADTGNQVVRAVSGTTGTITLLAGTYFNPCGPASSEAHCGDGSSANGALLNTPTGIMIDGSGNVFIADELDSAIREVIGGAGGNIKTVAGIQFNRGYYGDGGAATSAELENPVGVVGDSSGNLFIADAPSNVVRKVDAAGTISTVAGSVTSCQESVAGPPCGDGGLATAAYLWGPSDVFVDSSGNLYIADTSDNAIRKIDAQTGGISTVAGNDTTFAAGFAGDGGAATSALLNGPSGVYVDGSGDIFIADTLNNRIRKVTANNGDITTVAGNGTAGYAGDGGAATNAQLNNPAGVSVDAAGNIYIADSNSTVGNNVIRMVDTSGKISTVAGDYAKGAGYSGDGGPATQAQLSGAWGGFVDFLGNLFISDSQNAAIRVANLSTATNVVGGQTIAAGNIDTVIGSGQDNGFFGDGGPASFALLHEPLGLRSDSAGNLYIADRLNWRIRKVPGIVATPPTANLSTSSLTFASQGVGSSSNQQQVIITNNGNISPLLYTIAFSGSNPGDFQEGDSCGGSVGSNGGTCTLNVLFEPTAVGNRSATMTIADAAAGIAQNVALSGTAVAANQQGFTVGAAALSPSATLSPGGSATSTITITSMGGFSAAVALSCSVSPFAPGAPGCTITSPVTPAANGTATSTLTVTTTAASALNRPSPERRSMPLYAVWLLLPALLLNTAGRFRSGRKKPPGYFIFLLSLTGCVFLVACGGGGSGSGGSSGTPAGTYTVMVSATAPGISSQTANLSLTVQ